MGFRIAGRKRGWSQIDRNQSTIKLYANWINRPYKIGLLLRVSDAVSLCLTASNVFQASFSEENVNVDFALAMLSSELIDLTTYFTINLKLGTTQCIGGFLFLGKMLTNKPFQS